MPQSSQYAVNGFYPWPVPVSLSDEAAVFACGPRLYRVDARLRALGRIVSGDVTQVVQTEDGVFALEWTRQGEAVLLKLDGRLQIVDRRSVFRGGPVDLDRLPDPYDLADWRNQMEYLQLTERGVFRLSLQPDGEDASLTAALVLDRMPLEGGETVRQVIGALELEAALGGDAQIHGIDVRPGDTQMWASGDQVFCGADLWDGSSSGLRHVLLRIGGDGRVTVLWDSRDVLAGRPCFFDFEREIMWTCSRPGEAEYPEGEGRRDLPLVARPMERDAPVLSRFPVWQDAAPFQAYFDGVRTLAGVEEYPIVLWQDRLLLDRERDGHLTAHPVRSGPPEDGEALEVEWLQGESDFSCERRAGVI